MKINYKHTALGLIDDPDNFNFAFPTPNVTPKRTEEELKEFGMSIIENSGLLKEMCGNNIQYVNKTFVDAYLKGKKKLKDFFYQEVIEDSGILISGGHTDGYTHLHTIYYCVCTVKDDQGKLFYNVLYMDFSKHSKAEIPNLDVYVSWLLQPNTDDVDTKRSIWNGYIEDGRDEGYWVSFITTFCLFKKYCDIETKVIEGGGRGKIGGQKYVNETKRKVTFLDCTWFTNLIRTGAFDVSGHLRWQPYGPNNSQRKLIWVSSYEKEGYTRKAKIISDNGG